MNMRSYTIAIAVCVILTLPAVACGSEAPITRPEEFVQASNFYARMQEEKISNPTRMDARIDRKEQYGVIGEITKIEDDKVQFHIEELYLEKDKYVECRFPSKNYVLRLNRGQIVKLSGKLNKVNSKIELTDCRLWQ